MLVVERMHDIVDVSKADHTQTESEKRTGVPAFPLVKSVQWFSLFYNYINDVMVIAEL